MTLPQIAAFAALITFGGTTLGTAQEAAEDLVGTWVMTEHSGRNTRGETFGADRIAFIELEILDYDGDTFVGTYSWELSADDLLVDDGTGVVMSAEETVIGVRDFDDTFIMVDSLDNSVFRLRLAGETTLEAVAYESGPHGVASRMAFERQ